MLSELVVCFRAKVIYLTDAKQSCYRLGQCGDLFPQNMLQFRA
jgi:hypothetical protein